MCVSGRLQEAVCETDSTRGRAAHFPRDWLCMPYEREMVRAVVRAGQEIGMVPAQVCLSLRLLRR